MQGIDLMQDYQETLEQVLKLPVAERIALMQALAASLHQNQRTKMTNYRFRMKNVQS
jgi:hypothetical protein